MVAVVGRANVGKSTLFNRLARERRALVENRPGVTRDRVVTEAVVESRRVLLVDTGGLDPEAEEGIESAIREQVARVVEAAAVILFVVDARDGVLPLDRQIADVLRRAERAVVVVVNKVDGPGQDTAYGEFHELGFAEVLPTSAEHRRGMRDLEIAIAERLPEPGEAARAADDIAPRVAIVGRPNAGKSSLLNRLLGEDWAIVSETPGTTRDSADTRLRVGKQDVVLIDTAGLRRPGRRTAALERGSAFMALRSIERSDVVLLVMDVKEGITDQDARIARLALDRGRPLVLVLNKWDAVDRAQRRPEIQHQIGSTLRFVPDPVSVQVSALTGRGTSRVLPRALALVAELRRSVTTAEINRALQEAVQRNPPPASGRRRARFYYATQTSSRPFTVLAFMNDPSLIPAHYRRYLESFFRRAFDQRSAPVRLRLRARGRADRTDAFSPGTPGTRR